MTSALISKYLISEGVCVVVISICFFYWQLWPVWAERGRRRAARHKDCAAVTWRRLRLLQGRYCTGSASACRRRYPSPAAASITHFVLLLHTVRYGPGFNEKHCSSCRDTRKCLYRCQFPIKNAFSLALWSDVPEVYFKVSRKPNWWKCR